jgi:hypothetical protein
MPRPVYSRPFIRTKGLSGPGDVILVPDGFVYVVRQLSVFADAPSGGAEVWFEHHSTDQTLWYQKIGAFTADSRQLDCRFTFFPSESFRFRTPGGSSGPVDVYAGGYQLAE